MTTTDPDAFRRVMSTFATGVTVMTSLDGDEPHGMTANAVSSVSLDPMLVLVCVAHDADMCEVVRGAGVFGLSILGADRADLSDHFADPARAKGEAGFHDVATHHQQSGVPLLTDALATLDCRVWATYDGGDHDIVVGEVLHADTTDPAPALGYFRSHYVTIDPATS